MALQLTGQSWTVPIQSHDYPVLILSPQNRRGCIHTNTSTRSCYMDLILVKDNLSTSTHSFMLVGE